MSCCNYPPPLTSFLSCCSQLEIASLSNDEKGNKQRVKISRTTTRTCAIFSFTCALIFLWDLFYCRKIRQNLTQCMTRIITIRLSSLSPLLKLSSNVLGACLNEQQREGKQTLNLCTSVWVYSFSTCTRMAVAFARRSCLLQFLFLSKQLNKIPAGECDSFKLLLQMNPRTLTTYLLTLLDHPFHFGRFDRHFSNNT